MTTHNRKWMLSRRECAAVPALLAGAALNGFSQTPSLTAGHVVDRIKERLGVPWRGGATDTFKTGDADTRVTGIAATVMSCADWLKSFVSEVPVEWIPAGDPFWRP